MMINPAIGASDFLPSSGVVNPANRAADNAANVANVANAAPVKPAPAEKTEKISTENVRDAVSQIEQFTQTVSQNLKFSIDEETGKTVVKIMDSQTNEMIRQIPSEEAINIARTLGKIEGLLFNDKA